MRANIITIVTLSTFFLAGCDQKPEAAMGDAGLGRQLAEENCQACHAIGPEGDSPLAGAPPFREVVKRWPAENLAEAFAEGIEVPHEGVELMPQFQFEPAQIDNLIAYLESLQQAQPK